MAARMILAAVFTPDPHHPLTWADFVGYALLPVTLTGDSFVIGLTVAAFGVWIF